MWLEGFPFLFFVVKKNELPNHLRYLRAGVDKTPSAGLPRSGVFGRRKSLKMVQSGERALGEHRPAQAHERLASPPVKPSRPRKASFIPLDGTGSWKGALRSNEGNVSSRPTKWGRAARCVGQFCCARFIALIRHQLELYNILQVIKTLANIKKATTNLWSRCGGVGLLCWDWE